MNVLRKISIDTVLLWLAVALCIAGLVWLGGAHAWIAALGVGVFVASSDSPACPTCGGAGTIESDEPFMMMSAVPCPACSPLTVGIGHSASPDKGVKAEQWEALAVISAAWIGLGPCSRDVPSNEEVAGFEAFHKRRGCVIDTFREYAGLAFLARLMAFVAAQEAPQATNPPRSCATCSRPLNAWQLRFDGGAELRCGRYDCAAKDKLVATREVQVDGTVREEERALAEAEEFGLRPVTQELIASVMTRNGLVLVNGTWTTPKETPPERPSQDPAPAGTDPAETAADRARSPLDVAALRTLAREADRRNAEFVAKSVVSGSTAIWRLNEVATDVPALASAVEQLADALEATEAEASALRDDLKVEHERHVRAAVDRDDLQHALEAKAPPHARLDAATFELPAGSTLIGLDDNAGIFGATTVDVPALYDQIERQAAEIERLKAQRGLTSEEMAIIERTRALVRERDSLRASVDLLDEQGRKMKAERDAALLEIERLKESLATACATGEPPTAEQDAELLDALAQIERMKPLVEAALKWDEEGASDDELLQAAQDYRDAEEGAA